MTTPKNPHLVRDESSTPADPPDPRQLELELPTARVRVFAFEAEGTDEQVSKYLALIGAELRGGR